MDIQTLREEHICYAIDRQFLLADLIEELPWTYDVASGVLSFGDRYAFQAEILGSEANEDATWLWSWANEMSALPPERIQAALKMKEWGTEENIPELKEGCLSLEKIEGHTLSMIAVGAKLGQAYYRGPHDSGAIFLLIVEQQMPWKVENVLQRISTIFPQVISNMVIQNHQNALRHYLNHYDLKSEVTEDTLLVRQDDQVVLKATFDESYRLQNFKLSIDGNSQLSDN
ncbi:MAG: hypothetical protein P1V19_14455 [Gimesia sp.]|nr:hypothetical protein [Gimesia sp.]